VASAYFLLSFLGVHSQILHRFFGTVPFGDVVFDKKNWSQSDSAYFYLFIGLQNRLSAQ